MTTEEQKLECQRQDAAALKATVSTYAHNFVAPHDASQDALEQACLTCQQKDAAEIRSFFTRIMDWLVGLYQNRHHDAHA